VVAKVVERIGIHQHSSNTQNIPGPAGGVERKRLYAAEVVKSIYDSLLTHYPNANIIIAGDFNDYPDDKSMVNVLDAKRDITMANEYDMVNLMYPMHHKAGTHVFQGHWGILDQFLVCSGLLKSGTTSVYLNRAQIFNMPWLLTTNAAGDQVPFRTNQGPLWKGGYSDHLPILLDLELRPRNDRSGSQ
jgi:hypothetical protein